MHICVRLPNWLGDVMMSLKFLHHLRQAYPAAILTVVIKKGLEPLVNGLPGIDNVKVFSKEEYKGITGVWRFGKELKQWQSIDVFFVLPKSFSAAIMAFASGAIHRVGFGAEGRSLLLTHTFTSPKTAHRLEEYLALLVCYNPRATIDSFSLYLPGNTINKAKYIVVNLNSEASSRRLPVAKAVELISLLQHYALPLKLVGSPKELPFIADVVSKLASGEHVEIMAGKTSLPQLVQLIQGATLMVSTDSGPAHIAGASGVPLVVLFGAGDETNTGPYHNPKAIVVRHGQLPCEPCVKNYCKLAPQPVCLMQLDLQKVITAADLLLKPTANDNKRV